MVQSVNNTVGEAEDDVRGDREKGARGLCTYRSKDTANGSKVDATLAELLAPQAPAARGGVVLRAQALSLAGTPQLRMSQLHRVV